MFWKVLYKVKIKKNKKKVGYGQQKVLCKLKIKKKKFLLKLTEFFAASRFDIKRRKILQELKNNKKRKLVHTSTVYQFSPIKALSPPSSQRFCNSRV